MEQTFPFPDLRPKDFAAMSSMLSFLPYDRPCKKAGQIDKTTARDYFNVHTVFTNVRWVSASED